MRVEGSPFRGWFTSFGGNGTDSVAGMLHSGRRSEGVARRQDVLKWNRQEISTAHEAMAAGKFKSKSISLYRSALGEEFITPTEIIVGGKIDSNGMKHKVYQLQPNIEGWNVFDASYEVRNDPWVISQWEILSQRLFRLYSTANEVNSRLSSEFRFPITMTVGSSRQNALSHDSSSRLPLTKNIIIRSVDLRLQLFDFGDYVQWRDCMEEAYESIFSATENTVNSTELQASAIV